jgi:hypothetical protein
LASTGVNTQGTMLTLHGLNDLRASSIPKVKPVGPAPTMITCVSFCRHFWIR